MAKRGPKQKYFGKLTDNLVIRVPDDVMGDIRFLAERRNVSLSGFVRQMLFEKIAQEYRDYAQELRKQPPPGKQTSPSFAGGGEVRAEIESSLSLRVNSNTPAQGGK